MDPIAPVIDALHSEGRLRVWSLVVTVFGDAVQPRGGTIAAMRLQALLDRLGIGNGALRTALSRLARDGLIERHRSGRTAEYRLSPAGEQLFVPAARWIYAAPAPSPETWTLSRGPRPEGAFPAGGDLWLFPGSPPTVDGIAVTGSLSPLTDGSKMDVLDPRHRGALDLVARDVAVIRAAGNLDPLEAVAARTVLVHRWRRIALRWPDAPAMLLRGEVAEHGTRGAVAATYRALLPASEDWLSGGGLDPMPEASPVLAARFGGAGRP